MMRIAFIVLLSLICILAKASDDGIQASASSVSSLAAEPGAPEAPAAGPETPKTNASELEGPSAEEASNENASFALKKVSVSEASNWPFVLLTLLAMIICILLIAWIVKRFSGLTGLGGRDLKIVSAIAVGSRERVAVVEVKGEQFLIGATPHNISLLHHFSEEELEAADAKSALEHTKSPSAFADKLQSILKQSPAADSEIK
jgi:flagellar protein FliO/FliZ